MIKAKDIIKAKGLGFFCEWIKEHGEKVIVDLGGADLFGADLDFVDLSGTVGKPKGVENL